MLVRGSINYGVRPPGGARAAHLSAESIEFVRERERERERRGGVGVMQPIDFVMSEAKVNSGAGSRR